MNNLLSKRFESGFGSSLRAKLIWIYGLSLVLALWAGATLAIDFVVMPSLANAGMMNSSQFIPAGFSIFHRFNGAELIAGGMMLTSALILITQTHILHRTRLAVVSSLLFVIPLVYFYILGPQMAGVGLASNLSQAVPSSMNSMHFVYWGLDCLKVACVALYLSELWEVFDEMAQA